MIQPQPQASRQTTVLLHIRHIRLSGVPTVLNESQDFNWALKSENLLRPSRRESHFEVSRPWIRAGSEFPTVHEGCKTKPLWLGQPNPIDCL
jgi:hypothetical protein